MTTDANRSRPPLTAAPPPRATDLHRRADPSADPSAYSERSHAVRPDVDRDAAAAVLRRIVAAVDAGELTAPDRLRSRLVAAAEGLTGADDPVDGGRPHGQHRTPTDRTTR